MKTENQNENILLKQGTTIHACLSTGENVTRRQQTFAI